MRSFLAASFLAFSVACQLAGSALAQVQSERQRAAISAFSEGDRLSAVGRWAEACAQYTESQRLDPQLGALLHVADCNERIGKLATAWNAFSEASALAEQRSDPRLQVARERTAALAPRVAQLRIQVAEPVTGLEVSVDGTAVALDAAETSFALDAGEHRLQASAPGAEPWTRTLRIADGTVERVQVPALRARDSFAAQDSLHTGGAQPERDPPMAPGATQRTLGWIAIGTGAAAGIATGVLLALQDDKADAVRDLANGLDTTDPAAVEQYDDDKRPLVEDQRQLAALSIATGVAGGVLLAVGVALLVTAPDDDDDNENAELTLAPALGPRAQLMVLRGRF
ncbi:MAG TPA: hypothetical protein VK509_25665 [Polyangiales bacterium]|nr:hypothetical protein [Polyangiales bacterium]